MRLSRTIARPAAAGALCFAITCGGAQPAPRSRTPPRPPTDHGGQARDRRRRTASSTCAPAAAPPSAAASRPASGGLIVSLQLQRDGRWKPIDRDRTDAPGGYRLRERVTRTGSTPRARPRRAGPGVRSNDKRRIGRLNVYRYAQASWYGPGLYGNHTGCGGTLCAGTARRRPQVAALRHDGHVQARRAARSACR